MKLNFENKLALGTGCYTATDIAQILKMPYQKVNRWMVQYWDGKLGKEFGARYSWTVDKSRAVSFHTLIEFYVMMQLSETGVKPKEVLTAHSQLAHQYQTAFPFAQKKLIDSINTDGGKIYLSLGDVTISLDGSNQLNLSIIKAFFKNLDFDSDEIASRFWPMGRESSILIDPARKFGHPIISGHNIYPEVLHNHVKAGDPIAYIALIYEISEKEVQDAIDYCLAKPAA